MLIVAVVTTTACSVGDIPNTNNNPLDGKTAAFVGDSISYGTNYHGGYGKLIGEQNNMPVTNPSKGGATIARNVKWSEEADGTVRA